MRALDSKDAIMGLEHLTLRHGSNALPLTAHLEVARIARIESEINRFLQRADLPLR